MIGEVCIMTAFPGFCEKNHALSWSSQWREKFGALSTNSQDTTHVCYQPFLYCIQYIKDIEISASQKYSNFNHFGKMASKRLFCVTFWILVLCDVAVAKPNLLARVEELERKFDTFAASLGKSFNSRKVSRCLLIQLPSKSSTITLACFK